MVVIVLTAIVKWCAGFAATYKSIWNMRERYFVGFCFWPKAAVQAGLSGVMLAAVQ